MRQMFKPGQRYQNPSGHVWKIEYVKNNKIYLSHRDEAGQIQTDDKTIIIMSRLINNGFLKQVFTEISRTVHPKEALSENEWYNFISRLASGRNLKAY